MSDGKGKKADIAVALVVPVVAATTTFFLGDYLLKAVLTSFLPEGVEFPERSFEEKKAYSSLVGIVTFYIMIVAYYKRPNLLLTLGLALSTFLAIFVNAPLISEKMQVECINQTNMKIAIGAMISSMVFLFASKRCSLSVERTTSK